MLLSLPNLLTYARIAAVPLTAVLLAYDYRLSATALFIAACVTDYFDGHLARIMNLRSTLGTMLDPIADKLLVCTVLIILCTNGILTNIHVVAVLCIIGREILVSGLREYLANAHVVLPVSALAKFKTAIQMVALVFLIYDDYWFTEGVLCLWIATLITIYTGYDYLRMSVRHALIHDTQNRPN